MKANRLGKRQLAAFAFVSRHEGWHTFATQERRAITGLAVRGLVEVNEFGQFRLA